MLYLRSLAARQWWRHHLPKVPIRPMQATLAAQAASHQCATNDSSTTAQDIHTDSPSSTSIHARILPPVPGRDLTPSPVRPVPRMSSHVGR